LEFFLNDAPDLIFGGVGVQVPVKTEKAARDETGKPGRESGDRVEDMPHGTSRRRIDDSAGMVEGEFIEALDDLAEEPAAGGGAEVSRQFQELEFEGDWNHRSGS